MIWEGIGRIGRIANRPRGQWEGRFRGLRVQFFGLGSQYGHSEEIWVENVTFWRRR